MASLRVLTVVTGLSRMLKNVIVVGRIRCLSMVRFRGALTILFNF